MGMIICSQIVNHKLRITNCESQIVNHKLRITNCESQIANHKLRITNCKSQITNHILNIGGPFGPKVLWFRRSYGQRFFNKGCVVQGLFKKVLTPQISTLNCQFFWECRWSAPMIVLYTCCFYHHTLNSLSSYGDAEHVQIERLWSFAAIKIAQKSLRIISTYMTII